MSVDEIRNGDNPCMGALRSSINVDTVIVELLDFANQDLNDKKRATVRLSSCVRLKTEL